MTRRPLISQRKLNAYYDRLDAARDQVQLTTCQNCGGRKPARATFCAACEDRWTVIVVQRNG